MLNHNFQVNKRLDIDPTYNSIMLKTNMHNFVMAVMQKHSLGISPKIYHIINDLLLFRTVLGINDNSDPL